MRKSDISILMAGCALFFSLQSGASASDFITKEHFGMLDKALSELRSGVSTKAVVPGRVPFYGYYNRGTNITADELGMPAMFSINSLSIELQPFSAFVAVYGANISGRFELRKVKTQGGYVYAETYLFSKTTYGGACNWLKLASIKLSLRMDMKGVIDQDSLQLTASAASTTDSCHSPTIESIIPLVH